MICVVIPLVIVIILFLIFHCRFKGYIKNLCIYKRPPITIWAIQWEKIKNIRKDKKIFGIEKWSSLIIPFIRYISISFYTMCLIEYIEITCRKITKSSTKILCSKKFIDFYIIIKIIFLLFLIFFYKHINYHVCVTYIVSYLIFETITILIEIFLVTDYTNPPLSIKRSIILLFINYQEIILCFAILYLYNSAIEGINCGLQAIYFSYCVAMTLGFGDFNAKYTMCGQIIVIIQLFVTSLLIFVLFSYFLSEYSKRNQMK